MGHTEHPVLTAVLTAICVCVFVTLNAQCWQLYWLQCVCVCVCVCVFVTLNALCWQLYWLQCVCVCLSHWTPSVDTCTDCNVCVCVCVCVCHTERPVLTPVLITMLQQYAFPLYLWCLPMLTHFARWPKAKFSPLLLPLLLTTSVCTFFSYNNLLHFCKVSFHAVTCWRSKEVGPWKLGCCFVAGELWECAPSCGVREIRDRKTKGCVNSKCNLEATEAVHEFTTLPSSNSSWQHNVTMSVDRNRNFQRYLVEIKLFYVSPSVGNVQVHWWLFDNCCLIRLSSLSVCPPHSDTTWNNSAATRRSVVKFYILLFFVILSQYPSSINISHNSCTLHADRCTFMVLSRAIHLTTRNVSDKNFRENLNIFCFDFFFRKFFKD